MIDAILPAKIEYTDTKKKKEKRIHCIKTNIFLVSLRIKKTSIEEKLSHCGMPGTYEISKLFRKKNIHE